MDASYVMPFVESTRTVFSTMIGLEVTCQQPVLQCTIPSAKSDVSGIIGLSGDVMGVVVLCLPMDSALRIVEKFTGEAFAPDSEDFGDAIGEVVNMISGAAKAKFEGKSVNISCPSVVVGAGHQVKQMSDAACLQIPCETECGPFAVEVCMKEVVDASKATAANASA